jgi:hypothetical protein
MRARFLGDCGWGDADEIRRSFEQRDEQLAAALREGRPVVLWFEHDLYDQLQLLQICALVAETGYEPGRLELIDVGTFPGRPDFKGLGELSAAELETLWPLRRPVDDELLAVAADAWAAVRAPAPDALAAFVHDRASPRLPHLVPALRRLLEELPAPATGLARSERQLLEVLADRPHTAFELFVAAQRREEAPFDGDGWFFHRTLQLGRLVAAPAGVRAPTGPVELDAFMRTRIAITDDGRRVLAGDADRVELVGIDRWLGGTHLTRDRIWRWDAEAARVA